MTMVRHLYGRCDALIVETYTETTVGTELPPRFIPSVWRSLYLQVAQQSVCTGTNLAITQGPASTMATVCAPTMLRTALAHAAALPPVRHVLRGKLACADFVTHTTDTCIRQVHADGGGASALE